MKRLFLLILFQIAFLALLGLVYGNQLVYTIPQAQPFYTPFSLLRYGAAPYPHPYYGSGSLIPAAPAPLVHIPTKTVTKIVPVPAAPAPVKYYRGSHGYSYGKTEPGSYSHVYSNQWH
ncbi:hypothetical protein QYM36_013362 [Artemia franciscana]|uniref:Uncharacterized protein n=1 Tax=Artemia franciscana TaxID=6661 RepID=A0AA88HCU6_ARTSF|nr:hypothetical protein QYM36_013362 [Artemia franciscana]